MSPDQASSAYDSFAKDYNKLDGGRASSLLGLDVARSDAFRTARGDVLEVGVGTGLNLDKYDTAMLTSLTLVDISDGMLKQAKARVEELRIPTNVPIQFIRADATAQLVALFGKHKFDTVIDSFSLCVMGNEGARNCLHQLEGVVKLKADGGRVLLLENTRSSTQLLGWYQDLTSEMAAEVGGKGCVYNQDVEALIKAVGLTIEKEVSFVGGLFRYYECTVSS